MDALRLHPARVAGLAATLVVVLVVLVIGLGPGGGGTAVAPTSSPSTAAPSLSTPAGSVPSPSPSPTPTPTASPTPSPSPSPTPAPTPTPSKAPPRTAAPRPTAVPPLAGTTSLNLLATYDVDLRIDYGARRLDVDATLAVTNTSGAPIDRLELNTVAARLGKLRLDVATVDGAEVAVTIDDQTLHVPLPGGLAAGATAEVRIAFRSTLRSGTSGSDWLFTRANGIVDAYRWLPWVSRAVAFDRPNHGDPFVTPVSPRVDVRITSDRAMTFATTGEPVGGPTGPGGLTQAFRAEDVRDFTVTASPTYRHLAGTSTDGDTTINVYTLAGEPASTILASARRALASFEALVGQYPYATLDIAQSAGGFGMEGPAIVWIPGNVASGNLDYLVHHEIAHQWFYALVGNNQATQPFADEAAADFLTRRVLGTRRASRCNTARLDRGITSYTSSCYYETIYIQGGNFLDDVRKKVGSGPFYAGLNAYIEAHRFGFGSTKALLDAIDAATPTNLKPTYEPRFPSIY